MSQIYSDNILLTHPKPEFEYYRKNTAGVYTDWLNTSEVIAAVPSNRRTQKTFRINGLDYICESDGVTFTNKIPVNTPIAFTLVTDGSYLVPANTPITGMFVKLSTPLTSFMVGTFPGDSDLITSQDIQTVGDWVSFYLLFKSTSNRTFYFSGIAGTVDIELIKQ